MHKYLITSKELSVDSPTVFRTILQTQLQRHNPTYALYRDKSNPNYNTVAADFMEVCIAFKNVKSFLHQHANLAKELGATGVHLTSEQFSDISHAKNLGLEVIISTHTHKEVLKAQNLGADAVTYGPIFTSPGKGEPKGIDNLKELLNKCDINVFALGGIVTQEHIDMIEQTKTYGFASIRYFY